MEIWGRVYIFYILESNFAASFLLFDVSRRTIDSNRFMISGQFLQTIRQLLSFSSKGRGTIFDPDQAKAKYQNMQDQAGCSFESREW